MQSEYTTAPADLVTHWRSLAPLQRCSRSILQPQPTWPVIGEVLLLCRDAVGVFYSPSRLGHSLGKYCSSAEMQSEYTTAPADLATHWGSIAPLQRCSRSILQPQPTWPLIGEVLLLCRDAVGVYYSPSRLGHSLGKYCSSAEMQSEYSTAPADLATHWGSIAPLQRCSRCILLPQLTIYGYN